jgi:hypothetical protein
MFRNTPLRPRGPSPSPPHPRSAVARLPDTPSRNDIKGAGRLRREQKASNFQSKIADYPFSHGKYKGIMASVMCNDKSYTKWVIGKQDVAVPVLKFQKYVLARRVAFSSPDPPAISGASYTGFSLPGALRCRPEPSPQAGPPRTQGGHP